MFNQHYTILIIEDNPDHSELIRLAFDESGSHRIVIRESLEGALSYIGDHAPDIIISDMNLPDGNSIDFFGKQKIFEAYPVILLTGFGDESIAVNAMRSGAMDYIVKSESLFMKMPAIAEKVLMEWNYRTEHLTFQKALEVSEARLKAIFNNASVGIALVTRDFKTIQVNETFKKLLGYDNDEYLNIDYINSIHPDDRERVEVKLADFMKQRTESQQVEIRVRKRDGDFFWVNVSLTPMNSPDGEIESMIVVVVNVDGRKKAEEKLKKNEERLNLALNATSDGLWDWDMKSGRVYFSSSYYRMIGSNPDEFPSIHREWAELMHPDDREYARQMVREHIRNRTDHFEIEFRINTGGDSYNWVMSRGKVVEWDNVGGPARMIGTHTDVTERRKFEERLLEAEKMELLGRLAGGVAHDLNNILLGILAYPDLMMMELPENSPLREYASNIQESGQRAAEIVQDMLTLTRRESIAMKPLNINETIGNYLKSPEFSSIQSARNNITFTVHLDPELSPIEGSEHHIYKTFMNLVTNAVEAIPSEGHVIMSTFNTRLEKDANLYETIVKGDYSVMRVEDNGQGIPREIVKKIFEPFFTRKKLGKSGSGLGLAIVWGTMKDHGGFINVESEVNSGTVFTLYFPVTKKTIVSEDVISEITDFTGNGEKILIIDDMSTQREIAENILQNINYDTVAVESGEKALDYLKKNRADLIVLDMIMEPGMDGLETYEKILAINPGQKALIVTGWAETENVRKTIGLGAGALLKKPYKLKDLALAVRSELDRKG